MNTSLDGIEIHPAADIYPWMTDEALAELAADIKEHGQRDPCVLYHGKLLDGRNRWLACQMAGIEPDACEIDEDEGFDPIAYVVSVNRHRRHMTESQLAMSAAKAKGMYAAAAKERQREAGGNHTTKALSANVREAGRASDAAGKAFDVSGRSVDFASTVLANGSPELIDAVSTGKVAVSRAAEVARTTPPERQLIAATTPKPKPKWTLARGLEDLGAVIHKQIGRWPQKHIDTAAHKLRSLSDEILDNGGLANNEWERPARLDTEWNRAACIMSMRHVVGKWANLCPDEEQAELSQVLRDLANQVEQGNWRHEGSQGGRA